ncbi:fimbria/pilus periplasmic chaperone [Stenotrophomonas maltophilia]|nr:fimbria/pilus periplasmic chaperone [Stenotrophomonas maltophilia]
MKYSNSIARRLRSVSVLAAMIIPISLGMATAHGAVAIQGTRVVYSEDDSEQIVKLTNRGDNPALVQNWIDAGDPDLAAGSQGVPFLLTPPIVRIEANQGQTLRLMHVPDMAEKLPKDRESVFYLNVLEIPPKRERNGENVLQLAVRTRIKLFFRPGGIVGEPGDAAGTLTWKLVNGRDVHELIVNNPSSFHVSINEAVVGGVGIKEPVMVGPLGNARLRLKGMPNEHGRDRVNFEWLDEYGATRSHEASLHSGTR